jgi:hypothetical protein
MSTTTTTSGSIDVYVGSVSLEFPCKVLTPYAPVVVGSVTRTRGGNLVVVQDQSDLSGGSGAIREIEFEWVPYSTIEIFFSMWASGAVYSADFEGYGSAVSFRFHPELGVSDIKHASGNTIPVEDVRGTDLDLWNGKMTVIFT